MLEKKHDDGIFIPLERKYDLICPVYWIDWNYLWSNIESWKKELPLKRIIFGINNKEQMEPLVDLLEQLGYDDGLIEIVDQTKFETLGYCLADLMKRVTTDWFFYIHADVMLTEHCWDLMRCFINANTGIIESERIHENDQGFHYDYYYYKPRAFSGFQMFQTKMLEAKLDGIGDDFIYRNEDIIFQDFCVQEGYAYKKTWVMHVHQNHNKKWTVDRRRAYEMQVCGIAKYTEPTEITIKALMDALRTYARLVGENELLTLYEGIPRKWKDKILLSSLTTNY